MNRILLAMAFLPTGLVKATGQRFTLLPVDTPVGFFFEAMYRTGPFWRFIGVVQVASAVMLLIPGTALLGALVSFPVAFSILLITVGVGFGNTVFIAAGMTLSAAYLICWDGDRVWAATSMILGQRPGPSLLHGMSVLERLGWVTGSAVGLLLFLATRGFVPFQWIPALLVTGALAALVVGGSWLFGLLRGTSDVSDSLSSATTLKDS